MSVVESQYNVLLHDITFSSAVERVRGVFQQLPKNREFVIDNCAWSIASNLDIPLEDVLEILWTPNPQLYPDVPAGIHRIAEAGSLPVIWTQGHVGQGDASDERSLSFQPLKVVRSGLDSILMPYADVLSGIGIPSLIGGVDKVTEDILSPVFIAALENSIERIVAVDDLKENLVRLQEMCNAYGITYHPVHIKRTGNEYAKESILSFDELPVYADSLYLLDLDRTIIDTDGMKEDLYVRISQCFSHKLSL